MLFKCFNRVFVVSWVMISALRAEPLLWNIPIESSKFIGRQDYLDKMKTLIGKQPLLLSGLSGIGKTSLAYQYVRNHVSLYDIVWKFDASKNMDFQIIQFAKRLRDHHPSGARLNETNAEECLRQTKKPWILLFDDAQSYTDVIPYFPETHGCPNKHIIVTSLSTRSQEQLMRVEKFTPQETLAFLRHHLGDAAKEADCMKLAAVLDHHPLALRQAVSFIRFTPGSSISDYIDYFQNKNQEFWDAERAALVKDDFRKNQPGLYTSIKISLNKLRRECPLALQLLFMLSQIHYGKIESEMIKGWIKEFAGGNSEIFGYLLDRALIYPLEDSQTHNHYGIHNYVRSVIVHEATDVERHEGSKQALQIIAQALPERLEACNAFFQNHPNLSAHFSDLIAHHHGEAISDNLVPEIKHLYFLYNFSRKYKEAFDLAKSLRKKYEASDIMPTVAHAGLYGICSYMDYEEGNASLSIKTAKIAEQILSKIQTRESLEEGIQLQGNILGSLFYWLGDFEQLKQCIAKCRELNQSLGSDLAYITITTLEVILKLDLGKFEEAELLCHEMISKSKTNNFLRVCCAHAFKGYLAFSLLKRGQYKEALQMAECSRELALEAAGNDDKCETVARALVPLSLAHSGMGSYGLGEEEARQAIEIFKVDFGNDRKNRRQAYGHFALATALGGQKKYAQALREALFAKAICEEQMTHLKVDDFSEILFKIVEIALVLKDSLLAQEHLQQHMEIFGLTHFRTVAMSKMMHTT